MEVAASKGIARAAAALQGPEYPDALEYLESLVHQLHGRSGVTMNGFAPLSWGTLADFCRFTGIHLTGDEALALMRLDAVLLNPKAEDPSDG